MKAINHPIAQVGEFKSLASKFAVNICIILILGSFQQLSAQCRLNKEAFVPGEEVHMNVYFHWGLLMPKAGSAIMYMDKSDHNGNETLRQQLTFKTTSFFDKIYSMRDTVDTHYDANYTPIYYLKKADEDGYFLWDEMIFNYDNKITTVPTKRWDRNRTKIDTTHVVDGCLFDALSVSMYLRGLDAQTIEIGDEFPANFIMGRDIIKVSYRYGGQEIIERGKNLYRTRKFYMDVEDEAVTQTKNALEIWLSDDENKIPIKIRAKLKIGAAEAYFTKAKGLRFPLTSEIRIPRL
jgi:hypothetical protein